MSQASDLIEDVICYLLTHKGVFYASLLSQMKRIPDERAGTCGVTIRGGRILLYYNPKFIEELKTLKERRAVLEHECLAPGTFLSGVNKVVEQVKKGDSILDRDGNLVEVTYSMQRNYKGVLYKVKPALHSDFELTGNHPLLVTKYKLKNHKRVFEKPNFVSVQNLTSCSLKEGYHLLVPKYKKRSFSSVLPLEPFIKFDNKCIKNHMLRLTPDLAWVLGFYTAEGSCTDVKLNAQSKNANNVSFGFACHRNKDKKYINKVQRVLREYGYVSSLIDTRKYKDQKSFVITLKYSSPVLGRAFREWCGKGAANKKIPDFIFYNKNEIFLRHFLKGFAAGDGCFQKTHSLLNTVSPTLAYQLQLAILNLGESARLSIKKDNSSKLVGHNTKPLYTVDWFSKSYHTIVNFKDFYGIPIRKITTRDYKGKVYNLETKSHTYLIGNIISHNCLHLVMDHHSRCHNREHQLWNAAGDIAINQLIEGLPKECLDHKSLNPKWKAPVKANAEVYYDILKKHQNKIVIKHSKNCPNNPDNKKGDQKGQQGQQPGQQGQQPGGECPGCEYEIYDENGKKVGGGKLIDNHGQWKEGDSKDISHEVVKQAVKEAKEQSEKHQGHGYLPSGTEEYVEELLKPPVIPWQQLLKRWVASKIKAGHKSSWKRPNRRYEEQQKGHIPTRKLAITVAIDTSGSISNDDLADFMVEIKAIQRSHKTQMTILECDADVQKEYILGPHTKVQANFKGRGGTSFIPVFDYIDAKNIKTDLLIYFTDLYGDSPETKPRFPVLWVATHNHWKHDDYKPKYGDIISIPDHTPPDKRKDQDDW